MKIKKNPKANLEEYSKVFTLLGLVLTLFISYILIEHKTYAINKPTVYDAKPTIEDDEIKTFVYTVEKPKVAPKKIQEPITKEPVEIQKPLDVIDPNIIKKEDNDIDVLESTLIKNDDSDNNATTETEIKHVREIEDLVEETVPYVSIDNVPVFPGCEKYMYDKEKSKKCFSKKISKFFNNHFDTGIANDLNLSGIQRIGCVFIIDSNGEVKADIQTSRTHPKIAEEIKTVLKDLPKMKPAKQNGKAVNLLYSLPVKFMIE